LKKLCIVTTTPLIVDFFLGRHLAELSRRLELSMVFNAAEGVPAVTQGLSMELIDVPMERDIASVQDAIALVRLFRLFRRMRLSGVVSVAPKAGLLAMAAAWLARVPFRCHIFQGEVWATRTGLMRSILRTADRLTGLFATHVLVVSRSERDFLVRERILPAGKTQVLGAGSIGGVDTTRFRADPAAREEIRERFHIARDHIVVLFLGRLKRDKGVLDLARAWQQLATGYSTAHLLLVGPDEDALRSRIEEICGLALRPRLHFEGLTSVPERFLAASDVLCLPSYREGFGCAVIEAGAVGLPVLASRIYGIEDAAIEGKTALMHAPGDIADILDKLRQLVTDAALRRRLGDAGRKRACEQFEAGRVVANYVAFFEANL